MYATVDEDLDEAAVIQGHQVRFATVNLAAATSAIRERLLEIVRVDRLTAV